MYGLRNRLLLAAKKISCMTASRSLPEYDYGTDKSGSG
jgi:hypothetical protein